MSYKYVYLTVLEKQRYNISKESWIDLETVERAYFALDDANGALTAHADRAEKIGPHVEVERLPNGGVDYRQIKIRQNRRDGWSFRYTFGYVKRIKFGKEVTE